LARAKPICEISNQSGQALAFPVLPEGLVNSLMPAGLPGLPDQLGIERPCAAGRERNFRPDGST
jgi:hypothetical protein